MCLGGGILGKNLLGSSCPDNLHINMRPQTGNLYLDHIPRRRKELKMEEADADAYSPAEVMSGVAKSTQFSPASHQGPVGDIPML